jgi:hypothetical protein
MANEECFGVLAQTTKGESGMVVGAMVNDGA